MSAIRSRREVERRRGGFALLVVLLVLIALLVLSAPFLLMARNADRASAELSDRSEARLALDAAARHARLLLGESHAGLDRTPYFDDEQEIEVDNRFDPDFLQPNDPGGLMWDLEREDVAGKIDLNSAPPQLVANLMGATSRFVRAVLAEQSELPTSSMAGFDPTGVVWVNGELIRYSKLDGGTILEPVRGLLGPPEGTDWRGGPLPPSGHDAGAPVIDQRAFAPALWRAAGPDGELRALDSPERLKEAGSYALATALGAPPAPKGPKVDDPDAPARAAPSGLTDEALRPLFLYGSVHGGVRGGQVWQRPMRLASAVKGGEDGILRLDVPRWVNPGSTLQVSDGLNTELALVQEVRRTGEVVLDRILVNDYAAWTSVARVLARRPVNLNTAVPQVLEAIFTNLQVSGRNSRITRDEAQKLAELVVDSRPFTGFEDFLRRVVLPAAGLEKLPSDAPVVPSILAGQSGQAEGGGFIDPDDALALYMNGLNANDAGLLYSTMPFAFTTRDVYDLELRATVGAPSGVERFSLVREETDLVVPQRELMILWARQEDFDEACRLDLEAPWWMTGPSATSRWDSGAVPPSRLWAHLGTAEGQVYLPGVTDPTAFQSRESAPVAEHVFASRDEAGWIHLWPSRVAEASQRLKGRVMHFDHETRDPEGRYLPDEVVSRASDDALVAWTVANEPLCRPLSLSLWVKPRAIADSTLFDLGGTNHDLDRVSLLLEGADLVLRVRSGGGDHPHTVEKEWGEARFGVAAGTGAPGLPVDTWSHVELDVRGDRPDQIHMLVNGLAHGVRTPGMTRLTGAVSQNDAAIPVESIEGFPARCTVRIGNELMEVSVSNGRLDATRQETGEAAGFGGRIAREEFHTLSHHSPATAPTADVPEHLGTIAVFHPAGTTVELYGYSLPVLSDVPVGWSELPNPLIPFRAARLDKVAGGQMSDGDLVAISNPLNPLAAVGGIGLGGASSTATGLVLVSADTAKDDPQGVPDTAYMPAFSKTGGYAALLQVAWFAYGDQNNNRTADNTRVGGVEIIRYSRWDGTTLTIAARGDQIPELQNQSTIDQNQAYFIGGRRAFVANWDAGTYFGNTVMSWLAHPLLRVQTYVIPISLPIPGGSPLDYLAAAVGNSGFAQITHTTDAEMTEWVRYDWFETANRQLVRDDPAALLRALDVVTQGQSRPGADNPPAPPPPPPPPPPGGGGSALSVAPASAPAVAPVAASSAWDPRLGAGENGDYPLSEAIETALQFRGVFGTFSHAHPIRTRVCPVFTAMLGGPDEGRPGRLDAAFLFDAIPTSLGWPVRVHRAHTPGQRYGVTAWTQDDQNMPSPPTRVAITPPGDQAVQDTKVLGKIYVSLQAPVAQPLTADPDPVNQDARLRTRLVCFPSGEKPRIVGRTTIGGGFDGSAAGAVPSAVVDEVVFGDAQFGRGSPGDPDAVAGASLVLDRDLDEAGLQAKVLPFTVRLAQGGFHTNYEFLTETPDDAGLLRIGDEIVCYDSRQTLGGEIAIAPGGRGLLGTTAQPHHATEPVTFLEHRSVTFLAGGIGATDSALPVANQADFPPEGTVLVGSEIVHYTRLRENSLEMPRSSSEPGKMDDKGPGLFRGRFGTTAAAHSMGEPVILFPFRYWDRWQERADAPELAYFKLSIDQPAAYWESCFFAKEDASASRIGVLQRSDPAVPWDAELEKDQRIQVHWNGDVEGRAIPIGHQSDRIEWRVFVQYSPGAFDLVTGAPHGWKETPRLSRFGAFYFGPGMVLSAVER